MTGGTAGGAKGSELSATQAALRFCLELAGLAAWTVTAWHVAPGTALRGIVAVTAVTVAGGVWAVFRVPGDASASAGAPVAVRGRTRLTLELALLLGGAGAVTAAGRVAFGLVLGGLVVVHYVATWARVRWLLGN